MVGTRQLTSLTVTETAAATETEEQPKPTGPGGHDWQVTQGLATCSVCGLRFTGVGDGFVIPSESSMSTTPTRPLPCPGRRLTVLDAIESLFAKAGK